VHFFFIWSGLIKPITKFVFIYWGIYKYIPCKIEIVMIEKFIDYSFALSYIDYILIILFLYFKLVVDLFYFDEKDNRIDYLYWYNNTILENYKNYILVFHLGKYILWTITSISLTIFVDYEEMNLILIILSLFLLILSIILLIVKVESYFKKKWKEWKINMDCCLVRG